MQLLDAFFTLAVPFIVVCVVVALVVRSYAERRGIYDNAEGEARRDAVNEKFRTTRGAVVIGVIFAVLWGVTVVGLVQDRGAVAFTFVVSALLLVPFFTVSVGVIMLYTLAVHAYARHKGR